MAAIVETSEVVENKGKRTRGRTVAATIPADLFETLEDYRWANRLNVAQVVASALEQYLSDK